VSISNLYPRPHSQRLSRTFGFQTFGTGTTPRTYSLSHIRSFLVVYGLANTLSGLFGLVQWPLDLLVKLPLDGNYSPVNAVLLVFGLASSIALTIRIWLGTKHRVIILAQ
jgi:hypothetical protein